MNIKKNIVSRSIQNELTYGGTNSRRYILIHETANTSRGAGAGAHSRLQANGNSRTASWHYQVDDIEIIQSFPDVAQCWHAGSRYYNSNSIGIEICVNSDSNFRGAINNAVELTKYLMKKYNIPISNVLQHHNASGKNCPRYLRSGSRGINWSNFINMVKGSKGNVSASTPSKSPSKSSRPASNLGLVDWLASKGQNSSFNNRAKLAKEYGISNYRGSAQQNINLLNKLVKDYNKNGVIGSKPSNKVSTVNIKVGDRVTLSTSAKRYATGQNIPNSLKGKQYTVQQVKKDRVLLKELYSWVYKSDVGGGSTPTKPKPKPKSNSGAIRVGSKVTLSNSATNYATGQRIPNRVKGKRYTVQQVKGNRVLLKELYSWVYKKDVGASGGSTKKKAKKIRVGGKVKIKDSAKKYATGQNIPNRVKGRTYTVQQVKGDRVLLKEIYSWVRKKDIR